MGDNETDKDFFSKLQGDSQTEQAETGAENVARITAAFFVTLRKNGVNKDAAQWLTSTFLEHMLNAGKTTP